MQLGLTPDQLAERRLGLGGSDVRRMLDDPVALWREKLGLAKPEDLSGNLAVQMGSFTEPLNAFWFEKVTGRKVDRRGELVISDRYPWMRANLDGVTTNRDGHRAYIDFKHVGRADEQMVLRYTPQMTHCAALVGADFWVLSVFIGNSKHEVIEQEVDPFYTEELIAKEREFWGYVERKEEPPEPTRDVLPPKPTPTLRTVVIDGGEVDANGVWTAPGAGSPLQPWPNYGAEFAQHLATVIRTQGAATVNAIAREAVKALVPEDVGEIRRGAVTVKRDKRNAIHFSLPKGE